MKALTVVPLEAKTDVVIECAGVPALVLDAMSIVGTGGVVCLTGVSSGGRTIDIDDGQLHRSMVLQNIAVVGSVNADRRRYEGAADALAAANPSWLEKLVTRQIPLDRRPEALQRQPDDVEVVIAVHAL